MDIEDVVESDKKGCKNAPIPEICVVTHPLGAAGENATRSLLAILSGFTSVSLVTADLPSDSSIADIYEVVQLTRMGAAQSNVLVAAGRFLLNQLRMCVAITRRDEEIVLFFGAVAYVIPIAWALLLQRTVVVEPRGNVPLSLRLSWERRMPGLIARFLSGFVWILEQIGYVLADAIITYTPSMATELGIDNFEEKLYVDGGRFVDTDTFDPVTPFESRHTIVGFVGRLDEEKGIRKLASVAEILPSTVTFRFVGDGELLPWLRDRLSAEIESGDVELAGWVDHAAVAAELNKLRLLVMPSRPTEGLPTTILEALACGTPVYVTPVAGVPDVIRDGETGFHMSSTEPDSMAEEIEKTLKRSDLHEVSRKGRELVVTRFSHDAAVGRYQAIFSQISYK